MTLFANEVKFIYSALLHETLEIPALAFNNESKAKGNITVIAMYSIAATGTSLNSTEINIPGTKHFTIMFGLHNTSKYTNKY